MRIKRIALLALLSLVALSAAAQQHPNAARGFSPEKVYQVGNIDNVNIFNGNVTVTLPLGGTYPVAGQLSYGLTLVYNSKNWDYRLSGAFPEAIPNRTSNAGLGWQVTLGNLISPYDGTSFALNEQGLWVYAATDGAEHVFYDVLHAEEKGTRFEKKVVPGQRSVVGYTRDGTYMRLSRRGLTVIGSEYDDELHKTFYVLEAAYEIEFGNGLRHVFTAEYTDDTSFDTAARITYEMGLSYRLRRMEDRFGNYVRVDYVEGASEMQWKLTDGNDTTGDRRTHVVNFTLESLYKDYSGPKKRFLVKSVDVLQPDGAKQGDTPAYRFGYGEYEEISESCADFTGDYGANPFTGCAYPRPTWARFLHSVTLPDDSMYDFDYVKQVWWTDACGQRKLACSDVAGILTGIQLPTGGSIHYEHGGRTFPTRPVHPADAGPGGGPFAHSPGVTTRRLTAPGETDQVWRYLGFPRNGATVHVEPQDGGVPTTVQTYREVAVQVTNPVGEMTIHYFSAPYYNDACYPEGDESEFGRPFTRGADTKYGDLLLSTEVFAAPEGGPPTGAKCSPPIGFYGSDTACSAVACRPLRRTFVKYEREGISVGGIGAGLSVMGDQNWRLQTTRTEFLDDPSTCTPYVNCPYIDTILESFDGLGNYRTEKRTDSSGNTRTTETLYDTVSSTATYVPGATTNKPDDYMIEPGDPWLPGLFSRQKTTDGTSEIMEVCFDRTTGFLEGRRMLAGATRSTKDVLVLFSHDGDGNVESERHFGGDRQAVGTDTACGAPATAAYEIKHGYKFGVLANSKHVGTDFFSLDLDIDANTGLTSASRDTLGNLTKYTWDGLRRLVTVTPSHDHGMNYVYQKATTGTGDGRARVTMGRGSGTDRTERLLFFDGLGRLMEERNLTATGQTARIFKYDGLNRPTFVSEVVTRTQAASALGTSTSYDAFGRVTTVKRADNTSSSAKYTGMREIERTVSVQTEAGVVPTTTTEKYDLFGRLLSVTEASDPASSTPVTTTYGYDPANRLKSVKTVTSLATQDRSFQYDGRGFLVEEEHPEKGKTTYSEYDARGNAWRIVEDGQPDPLSTSRTLTLKFDAALRLEEMSDTSEGLLKKFKYDHNGTAATPGKLGVATRYNPYGPGGKWTVEETYSYDVEGRVAGRATTVLDPGNNTVQTFDHDFTYNRLGIPDNVHYPAAAGQPERNVALAYQHGLLTRVGSYTFNNILYWPSGVVQRVEHANGVVDVQAIDPVTRMIRPHEVRFEGWRTPSSCEPLILGHPISETIEESQQIGLTIAARDADSYQWYIKSGSTLTAIDGATSYSYPASPTTTTTYVATATNSCGTATSQPATITVIPRGGTGTGTPQREQTAWKTRDTDLISTSWNQPTKPGSLLIAILSVRNAYSAEETFYAAPAGWQLAVRSGVRHLDLLAITDNTTIYYMENAPSRSGSESFALVKADGSPRSKEPVSLVLLEYSNMAAIGALDRVATDYGYGEGHGHPLPPVPMTVATGTTATTRQANELVITSITGPGSHPVSYADPSDWFEEIVDLPLYVADVHGAGGSVVHERIVTQQDAYGHTATSTEDHRYAGAVATFRGGGNTSSGCTSPSITTPPTSQPGSGGQVALFVQANGTAPLTYQWYIGFTEDISNPVPSSNAPTISVTPGTLTRYWVRITNSCGFVNSPLVEVSFQCIPAAVQQHPSGASITSGETVELSAIVTGSTPRTLQWYEGDRGNTSRPITGANSPILPVSPSTTTSYWLRVKNACGEADSLAAEVKVCTKPNITQQPKTQATTKYATIELEVIASGNQPFTYQWYEGESGVQTNPIAGANGSKITVQMQEISRRLWVEITNVCGVTKSDHALLAIGSKRRSVRSDFDGNGTQDVVFRNFESGQNVLWLMDKTAHIGTQTLPAEANLNSEAQGVGDFNGDGKPDLFWRNAISGANELWLMDGVSRISTHTVEALEASWNVGGVDDFDGDGRVDLFWRNSNTGANLVWLMDGAMRRMSIPLRTVADTSWNMQAAADFNGDTETDLLWRNYRTGENRLWIMDGTTLVASRTPSISLNSVVSQSEAMPGQPLETVADTAWRMQQAGDFDGDDRLDIVWRHYPTGKNDVWIMASSVHESTQALETLPGAEWRIQGSGGGQPRGDVVSRTSLAVAPSSGVYRGSATLNATLHAESGAPVAGKIVRFTVNGTVAGDAQTSAAGTASLTIPLGETAAETYATGIRATFAGDSIFTGSQGTSTLTVTKAPVTIMWAAPEPIIYGTSLGTSELNATASVAGTFTYMPAAGTVLSAGIQQLLSVVFTPADPSYETATASVRMDVRKASPLLHWTQPAPIVYGTPLSATQLNASTDAAGTFTYTPAAGTVLNAGNGQVLRVLFTPADPANYQTAEASVTIDVAKARPVITWVKPAGIVYGSALSATQLNATADVGGTFTYTPAAGTVLAAGEGHVLHAALTPSDAANYETAEASVRIDVAKAKPVITWAPPAGIVYGTELDAPQLNANADVPGTFVYTPSSGTILDAGDHQELRTAFTPNDTYNYELASASVTIDVAKARQTIAWNTPSPIVYGTPLSSTQLNATVSVVGPAAAGAITNVPAAGTVLDAGERSLTVNVAETSNYLPATSSVNLTVMKAKLTIVADNQRKLYGGAIPTLTGTLTGVVNGDPITARYTTAATVASPASTYPIVAHLDDPNGRLVNYDVTSVNATLTLLPAPLTIRADDKTMQYSDPLPVLTATFTGLVLGETPAVLGGVLTLATTATITSAPGVYPIAAGDVTSPNYVITFIGGTLTVTPEDATLKYTGPRVAATTELKGTKAVVTLSTTLQDAADGSAGDIGKAIVTFVDRATGNPLCTGPVGMLRPDELHTGIVSCSFQTDIGTATAVLMNVGTVVSGYYSRDAAADDVALTINAAGSSFATGGGHLLLELALGRKAGDINSKMNFGYSAKYHPQGKGIDGNLMFDVRRAEGGVERQFKITATSYNFVVADTTTGRATVQGLATIEEIGEGRPTTVATAVPFQLTATQKSATVPKDALALALWDPAGGLWLASRWESAQPVEQELAGGNVSVQGGR